MSEKERPGPLEEVADIQIRLLRGLDERITRLETAGTPDTITGAETALAEFENMCAGILLGKGDEAETKRITKAMVDTGQTKYMHQEFTKMGKQLA